MLNNKKLSYEEVLQLFYEIIEESKNSTNNYSKETPWDYWISNYEGKKAIYQVSEYLIKKLLWNLHEFGLERFTRWYEDSKQYLKSEYNADHLDY